MNEQVSLICAGNDDSGGVWAPCLSYSGGRFYLIYSDVKSYHHTFFDVKNYLVTAENIRGPWSEPIYLNSSGFDPSFFHDDDGRKYLVNMQSEYRTWKVRFSGMVMREFSEKDGKLIGERKIICKGFTRLTVEGPHLYKHGDWYYLFCAEGGTSWRHCETVWRSRSVDGPYEISPFNPLITLWPYPENSLQKGGTPALQKVRTAAGFWRICADAR